MKKTILSALLFLFLINVKGQNLVPNGDFEQYSGCPTNLSQLNAALFWHNPNTATPDYFNQCANAFNVGVPANFVGYQPAHSGVGYAGTIIFAQFPPYVPNQREYIEVSLLSSLVAGNCYHFEMYVNRANRCQYATDDLGVYFSDTLITGIPTINPLPFTPQITNLTGTITDTVNWILIAGNYTAAGGENYLVIGNFKNDTNTTIILIDSSASIPYTYLYIDDVSLTSCTGVNEQNQNNEIIVYPNPAGDELFVKGYPLSGKTEIKITDILGKEIYRGQLQTLNFKLQTSNFNHGIYFIEINDSKNIYRKKFLKE